MPTRKYEQAGPQVTIRFAHSSLRFPMPAGHTLGDLAGRLSWLSEGRATPLSIDLTFPPAANSVLH